MFGRGEINRRLKLVGKYRELLEQLGRIDFFSGNLQEYREFKSDDRYEIVGAPKIEGALTIPYLFSKDDLDLYEKKAGTRLFGISKFAWRNLKEKLEGLEPIIKLIDENGVGALIGYNRRYRSGIPVKNKTIK